MTKSAEKEIKWFIRKYINTKHITQVCNQLSPYELTLIVKECFKNGFEFDWGDTCI